MLKFTWNDGGKSESKRPQQANDCVVRAIAIVTQVAYDDIYDELAMLGRSSGRGTDNRTWKDLVKAMGFDVQVIAGQETLASVVSRIAGHKAIIGVRGHAIAFDGESLQDMLMTHPSSLVYALALAPQKSRREFEVSLTKKVVYE